MPSCFDCKSTKNLRAIHNIDYYHPAQFMLFRLQKYKKFESNSQQNLTSILLVVSCFDCKSTKNLRAIHNPCCAALFHSVVVSTAKVQKIWEQFTTTPQHGSNRTPLFRLQKYKKFESNSQRFFVYRRRCRRCFDCKSTKNLRAIHNGSLVWADQSCVVSTAKVQKIWEQFTTATLDEFLSLGLFRLQKYKKFESNSQPIRFVQKPRKVVSTAKVQKIWEQFTTLVANLLSFSHERQDVQRCTFGCRSIEVTIPDWWCDRW